MRMCRIPLVAATMLAFAGLATAADEQGVLVDLLSVSDNAQVERLKHSQGTRWWVEAGEVLLLAGDVSKIRASVPAHLVLRDIEGLKVDRLALRPRGCGDHRQPLAESDLLLVADTFELVHQPLSFAPAGLTAGTFNPHLGGPEFEPVAPNTTVARLHRFDRPEGTPAADPAIAHIAGKVDGERWFTTVSALTEWDRSSFSAELPQARGWIGTQFAKAGLTVTEPQFSFPFTTPVPLANVIGTMVGSERPDEWVIIGAHYDSRNEINNIANAANTPGADDNASGCAGVIEAARVLQRYRPRRTVMFMCYAGEEQGLYGSRRHVEALNASGDIGKVQAMLNLDMIGWVADLPLGVAVCTRSSAGTGAVSLLNTVADAMATYAPELLVTTGTTVCSGSDHVPYLELGRPATHSIHRGGVSYPHYHRTTDTPANLGPLAKDVGEAIVRGNVAALVQLAGYDLLFADDFQD
jgi:hypothetical protein